ncbi:MAG: hypothetical protein E6G40_13185 [Actinobacteria bacterium]|nr:MAG: hypothetical protein E6G40_13185 [Actinomycetota bacterium]
MRLGRALHRPWPILIFLCLTTLLLAPTGSVAAPASASVRLKPTVGPPTTKVKVTGAGFGSTEQVIITFDSTEVGSATTDPSGSFTAMIKTPASAAPGDHTVTATGQSSGFIAWATFRVRTDWPKFRFDDSNSGYNRYENVLSRSNVFRLSEHWAFRTGSDIGSSPAVSAGVAYAGSDDYALYAIDASTGTKLWTFVTGSMVASSPAVANGVVYVGSWDGTFYALNAATGSKLWSFTTGSDFTSSPVVAGGMVYMADEGVRIGCEHRSEGVELRCRLCHRFLPGGGRWDGLCGRRRHECLRARRHHGSEGLELQHGFLWLRIFTRSCWRGGICGSRSTLCS